MQAKSFDNDTKAFLALVKTGLWESKVCLRPYGDIDFKKIYKLAREQAVVGLVAAGLEHTAGYNIPKEVILQFVDTTLQLEQRNQQMNRFLNGLLDRLKEEKITALLVKGQGVAQCYERPLWRASGDIDLLLDEENYHKAKDYLSSFASSVESEVRDRLHLAMTIDIWTVELHGSLRGNMLEQVDMGIDKIQQDVFLGRKLRVWNNEGTEVLLPAPTEDSLFVFTHILHHFTQGGIGLRQICDWCRLLWTYREEIDHHYLDDRLKEMGLMSEWKVFDALAVEYLGMPEEAMPFYASEVKWKRKADCLMKFILKTGNMGVNRDTSYYERHSYVVSKFMSLKWHTTDAIEQFAIFPLDSVKIWGRMIVNGFNRIKNHR